MSHVRLSDLKTGETYFAVYTATGRCVYRTRDGEEAAAMVERNPRLEWQEHIRS